MSRDRLTAFEALIGVGLVVGGVALWSVAAALVVAGGALLGFVVWPSFARRG